MVDAQIYWVHLGGQLNSGPGVWNNVSYGLGTGYTYHNNSQNTDSFFENIGFTLHYLTNQDNPPGMPEVEDQGVSLRVFTTVWDTYLYGLFWDGGSPNFNSARGDITQPGVALAKGDPFYRADDFQEAGVIKALELADNIYLTFDLRAQFIQNEFEHIAHLNVTWRDAFALFEEYFSKKKAEPRQSPKTYWPRPR